MGVALVLALSKKRRNLELLADLLAEVSTEVAVATEIDEFEALLTEREDVSMAVIDVGEFTRDIWERSERLREAGIPVSVLTMAAPRISAKKPCDTAHSVSSKNRSRRRRSGPSRTRPVAVDAGDAPRRAVVDDVDRAAVAVGRLRKADL
ncbi:hypothetical protein [Haloarcula nitratireducens]|uniref:hypothetical protein n=1 Tax=Haloarcula nitratireducens TaxID=2487749 RepID=UPI001F1C622C|nr:hypothetical protein [Halomicroarcula nitratireducens]